jgi:hypothetical protein
MSANNRDGLSGIPVTDCDRIILSQACNVRNSDVTRKTEDKEKTG